MSLLSVKNMSVSQNIKTLFENATFGVDEKDKVAVIGPNGCGKTTLLTILANHEKSPEYNIVTNQGLSISYLAQTLDFNPDHTIKTHLFQSPSPAAKAMRDYQECLDNYQDAPNTKTEEALTEATDQMNHLDAWEYEARVSSILSELNIKDLDQEMKDLSGGMLKKVALAQVFFEQTDLLILDEPTNHLDLSTIEWLEGMLQRYQSALIMVTHDRYFLDKVCTKVFEIDQQKFFVYRGNYQTYLEQRELRYAEQDKHEQSIQSVLKVELAWLRRGPKARSTKQKARKERIGTMLQRDTYSPEQTLELNVSERRLGKKICELKEISKSFDSRKIIDDFSYTFKKGERIGILGPNGAGKTTLLNLIMSKLSPDTGEVDVGVNTVFGYFDQHSQNFDLEMTIFEHVNQIGSQIKRPDGSTVSVSKLLEQFLFPSQMLKTQIGKLSGGEKRRLYLVCLLLENPNFLLFDEPTNDLDIQTLSVLENFLETFAGCVIVISHDRYFMDRVVDRLFVFNSKAQITPFDGNYTDYSDTLKVIQAMSNSTGNKAPASEKKQDDREKETSVKLNNKERETLKRLEKEIDKLESEKAKLNDLFSLGTASSEDYADAGKRLKSITEDLENKLTVWTDLAERA
jgi:ABC transport system ATP-binding/permease protein